MNNIKSHKDDINRLCVYCVYYFFRACASARFFAAAAQEAHPALGVVEEDEACGLVTFATTVGLDALTIGFDEEI
jgi:hypothetical protein